MQTLQACWAEHGAGLVALHARLTFRDDALEALTLGEHLLTVSSLTLGCVLHGIGGWPAGCQ